MNITDSSPQTLTWECPDCSFENEIYFEDNPPTVLHCCICNHESDEITWKKVSKE